MRRTISSTFLLITGIIACPCHLALTLPLLLALFGGTAVGAFLAAHTGLIVALSTGYFVAALGLGWWWLSRPLRRTVADQCAVRPTAATPTEDEGLGTHPGAYR
ncbi:MAG: hypothetical protein NVS2B7_17870 [Herpetosiphon sp.]